MAVVSPARNTTVASQRQRVVKTRCDGDEVALHAFRRRLAVAVVSPARDVAANSQCKREITTRCKIHVGSRRGFAKLVAFLDDSETSWFVHDNEPFAPDVDGGVSPLVCGTSCFHGLGKVGGTDGQRLTVRANSG